MWWFFHEELPNVRYCGFCQQPLPASIGPYTVERELARRPWVHQRQYVQIDRILAELVPRYFLHRKLESEYATLFLEEKGAGAD